MLAPIKQVWITQQQWKERNNMAAIKKKLPPKLTPQYKESQKLLAVKVDALAKELGIQWGLMDTPDYSYLSMLAQAAAQADLAIHVYDITRSQAKIAESLDKIAESLVSLDHRLAGRSGHPGYRTEGALGNIHNALEKIAKAIEIG
jgi:hypothetical protein